MMGFQSDTQQKLFYTCLNLEKRIRKDHILRDIANHSVLSKARARWGLDVFRSLFESIVRQCVEAGLVDGSRIFTDASLVQADASNNSVVNQESLKRYLNKSYLAAAKTCRRCSLKPRCTRPKQGRTLKRHIRQDELDRMLSVSESRQAKGDIRKRQHLMERSFARSYRYGYQRARWRRLWRVQIQEHLTATIQNIRVLVCNVKGQGKAALASSAQARPKRPSIGNIFLTAKALLKASISFLTLEPC